MIKFNFPHRVFEKSNFKTFYHDTYGYIDSLLTFSFSDWRVETPKKRLVLCSPPKAASTFLTNILQKLLGVERQIMIESTNIDYLARKLAGEKKLSRNTEDRIVNTNHRLDENLILAAEFSKENIIHAQHTTANTSNMTALSKINNLYIVVPTRNILDSLVSLINFQEKGFEQKMTGKSIYPFFYEFLMQISSKNTIEKFMSGSKEYRMDLMIDLFSPWYMEFYLSWERAKKNDWFNIKFSHYEDMVKDQVAHLKGLIESFEEPVPSD